MFKNENIQYLEYYSTKAESEANLPKCEKNKPMYKMVRCKGLIQPKDIDYESLWYFCYETNHYYHAMSNTCDVVWEEYNYKGNYLGFYLFKHHYVYEISTEINYFVDYIPALMMYDNLPISHEYNSVIEPESWAIVKHGVHPYICCPSKIKNPPKFIRGKKYNEWCMERSMPNLMI